MIAYDKNLITNIAIVKKAKQLYSRNGISAIQMNNIIKNYKTDFYTPNLFIKTGLFIFTYIAISAALGFVSTLFLTAFAGSEKGFGFFTCIFFSIACIVALELFIRGKKIYHSGLDQALLFAALGFLASFVGLFFIDNLENKNTFLLYFIILLPFAFAAVVRYSNWIISIIFVLCTYAIFFLIILNFGAIAKLIMPFALMVISVPIYFIAKKQKQKEELVYWEKCITAAECIALLVFYAAGNYFVIRESSIAFFDLQLNDGQNIPLAFLFYFLTALVPLLYVYYGLKKKDKVLLWIGLLLVTAAALTFKNYFSLGHPEIALTVAGLLMILIAYFSIRYLKTHKDHITFEEELDEDNFLKSNSEALLIAQSFSQQSQTTTPNSTTSFGGGDFGGAGSGGSF